MRRGIQFTFSDGLYHKDPQDSSLGKRILEHSIELIVKLGIDNFTFKKLATHIGSAEASIYRYFENKHKLLVYLTCWYWEWVHYLIDMHTINIENPEKKLKITIHQLLFASKQNTMTEYINEKLLHQILVTDGVKAIHHNDVDAENNQGIYRSRANLVDKIKDMLLEINPDFEYPETLASTMIDMAINQIYYAEHLPKLSSLNINDNLLTNLEVVINHLVFSCLTNKN